MDVKLRTLPTQVAGVLARRIAGGEFTDGLAPSEQQISTEFGVSRAVAREALKILRALDMVDIAQGRRVTLRPPAEWDYLSPLMIEWLPPGARSAPAPRASRSPSDLRAGNCRAGSA